MFKVCVLHLNVIGYARRKSPLEMGARGSIQSTPHSRGLRCGLFKETESRPTHRPGIYIHTHTHTHLCGDGEVLFTAIAMPFLIIWLFNLWVPYPTSRRRERCALCDLLTPYESQPSGCRAKKHIKHTYIMDAYIIHTYIHT